MPTNTASRPKLSKAPISLTLCQVRFSNIRKMGDYISKVQDNLAKAGYELDLSDKVQEFTLTPEGPQAQTIDRWEFADLKRIRSCVITQQFAVFQTTAYDTFESFAPEMLRVMDAIVQAGAKPIITRVGLRYTDAIILAAGKSLDFYLHKSLLGVSSPVLRNALIAHNTIAETAHGRMLVRIMQNQQRLMVPIELGQLNLLLQCKAPNDNSVITLLDFDHFKEWPTDAAPYQHESLKTLIWDLKNGIYDVFNAFVTPEAIEEWK
ncbi:MAG: TIGR04255 family protein [Planctomycetes bacterium]|nr:TIGR04255 family protein [Planctomycetota bacterium]